MNKLKVFTNQLNGWQRVGLIISIGWILFVFIYLTTFKLSEINIDECVKSYFLWECEDVANNNKIEKAEIYTREVRVDFKNGNHHIYKDLPDNITPSEVSEMIQRDFDYNVLLNSTFKISSDFFKAFDNAQKEGELSTRKFLRKYLKPSMPMKYLTLSWKRLLVVITLPLLLIWLIPYLLKLLTLWVVAGFKKSKEV